jgi:hypothetical protein
MSAQTISQLPIDDNSNGWSGILEPRQAKAAFEGEQKQTG